MIITVDTREPKQHGLFIAKAFPQHTIRYAALKEGDYSTDKVLVERKRIADFYGSIMGSKAGPGRLPAQVARLSCHDDQVVVILIIGSVSDFIKEMQDIGIRVDPDILFSTAASICARERIHVIWMVNEWDALITMVKFMNKVNEGSYMVPSRREPDMLAARLLGVTVVQFVALKKKFKTLAKMGQATDAELSQIYGIGKAKAKRIRDVINLGW